jgi:hypothetical protein
MLSVLRKANGLKSFSQTAGVNQLFQRNKSNAIGVKPAHKTAKAFESIPGKYMNFI